MKLDFIKDAFLEIKTKISTDGETITLFNPHSKENIVVDYEFFTSIDNSDSFERYTAQFSYQHRNFSEESEVLEWINGVINNTILAIEMFKGRKKCGGGELHFSNMDNLNDDINEYCLKFLDADSFKIRSWNCTNNYSGCIIKKEDNKNLIILVQA